MAASSSSLPIAHGVALLIIYVVVKGFLSFKGITDALAFYGVYHRHPINQFIHFFGVPCIIWSLLVFNAHLNIPLINICVKLPGAKRHRLNYASVLTVMYIAFYLSLDKFGGSLYAPFAYFMYVHAVNSTMRDQAKALTEIQKKSVKGNKSNNVSWTGTGKLLKVAAFVHFIGWYVQIHPGHKIYEGASPAITQSLGGALSSAPLFAYYEGLWFMGLNKELQDQTKVLVDEYSIELCKNGLDMRSCKDYDLN